MPEPILVAFASGSEDLWPALIEEMRKLHPGLPLWVVSEFPVAGVSWVPWHIARSSRDNLDLLRWTFRDKEIVLCGILLQPRMPYWPMRRVAFQLGGLRSVFFNENLNHFMLRPRSAPVIARHFLWRARNFVRWELRPGGATYTWLWRLRHPGALRRPILHRLVRAKSKPAPPPAIAPRLDSFPAGISVIIPSRNGRDLLDRLLPTLLAQLPESSEVIVIDNGSDDGTAEWLRTRHPALQVEEHPRALSFAAAVNRGIQRARYSRTLLLNNDMTLEPGFFPPLDAAFQRVPDLFCATAQILFPAGQRREETGKAFWSGFTRAGDFPVRCDVPLPGEDHTWVLYGSGGCSLFDTAKLRTLGGMREIFTPAYVEDLDLGFRGWQQGWPSVFVAGAQVIHRHRSTTSRYFTQREIERAVEVNLLRFLAATLSSPALFADLWRAAVSRLNLLAARQDPVASALDALEAARAITPAPQASVRDESEVLALTSGEVAVFPGEARPGRPAVLIASPYVPFPLSHGGAVRMYNLIRRAAPDFDQVLVCFCDEFAPPAPELLAVCAEIVLVRRRGSHARALTPRPDTVEEFDSAAFRAALRECGRKWRPSVAQLEFTQLAQYAADCAPARTILVEHDVTLDLYEQLLANQEDWETRRQLERWIPFETAAWNTVDKVITMSEKDRLRVGTPNAVALANGVDLERFAPSAGAPEPRRLLFIGSFAHLPNVLALEWFLREVWPALPDTTLHVIAGKNHQYFLDRHKAALPLGSPGIEVEDFVADPRPAYRRAAVVIAPLLASAGTNIKIMEAMAMGKAIVATPGGINGLDELRDGEDVLVARGAGAFAAAVRRLLDDPSFRVRVEQSARARAEAHYDWDRIALEQKQIYQSLMPVTQ